ncbi:carbohydrate ABC transporter permease [Ructibacterium gallinarum]|uniref:Carbohydrate ABC transporter permease n=1 Tax=Ructibacterium gallinarum TaxID=2779355 RepID=A0A9D5R9C6_9FIRM|nr:carbohydrate ABC transporter permease [Ructibacterium gallinarum]MBE5040887.1 carbohydrate ABC transporter permease [Ructibacterium gallinarum]
MHKNIKLETFLHAFFLVLCACSIIPLLLVISVSLTSESGIVSKGYTLLPSELSTNAYEYIFKNGNSVARAYGVTIINTITGAGISTLLTALFAYGLSKKDFRWRKIFTFYVFFTMLFNGGTVAWYIVCTKWLNLSNTIWAMILPYLMNAWNIIILRTFFSTTIPDGIIESAKLDGAGEFRIFFQLVLPISLPGIATIALFQTLAYWNDWWLPLLFITEPKLYNLQFILQNMMNNIQKMSENSNYALSTGAMDVPSESARMALCIIATGPILFVYPFFQKYFIQGLTVGAIKG